MPATPRTLDFEDLYERARQNGATYIDEALQNAFGGEVKVLEVTHDVIGPKGGTSSQVLFTMEVDGQIMPVLCSIYANRQIDNRILAVAKERERLAERDTALREALGLVATTRTPALAGMPLPDRDPCSGCGMTMSDCMATGDLGGNPYCCKDCDHTPEDSDGK